MNVKVFCDSSFNITTKTAIIAVLIKVGNKEKPLKSMKKIACRSSAEAEFRAINKAVGMIKHYLDYNALPNPCNIEVYCDCRGVIERINRKRILRGVGNGLSNKLLCDIAKMREKNNMKFIWIPRGLNNEAHMLSIKANAKE
ncbi:MAG: RNase H family protein [Ignavibacteriales bacterium]